MLLGVITIFENAVDKKLTQFFTLSSHHIWY